MTPDRRAMIAGAVAAGAFPQAAFAAGRTIAGHRPADVPSAAQLGAWLKQLHDFGPIRATGTPQARAFEEWLATAFAALGCTVERDRYRLTSWECSVDTDCAVTVKEDGGRERRLEVVSYYPFCGSTRGTGPVTGRALYAGAGVEAAQKLAAEPPPGLKDSIVVVELPIGYENRDRIDLYPERFGVDDPIPRQGAPFASAAGGRGLVRAMQDHCRGLVLCYTDVSNAAAKHNYLPFSEPHGKIPALWVGAADRAYLKGVSGKASITLRCDARLTPDARADSLVATLKGRTDEVVFLTTHTDGPNEVNDNGALGLLACATYAARRPVVERKRTLVFSLPTGHYAMGAVADPVTGSGKRAGTGGVMDARPEMMKRVVAQLAMEQMGAMEWLDIDGRYVATGRVASQYWLPTNEKASTGPGGGGGATGQTLGTPEIAAAVRRMFMAATEGEDPKTCRAGLVHSGYAPGEGGGLRARGIPGIGLMGYPSYFFRADPKGVLDKLSPQVMKTQVDIFTKLMALMDRLSVEQLKGLAPITDRDLFG